MVLPSANSTGGSSGSNSQQPNLLSPGRGARANAATRSSPRKTSAVR